MITDRIAKVRSEMMQQGMDALIVSSLTNVRYLPGFTGSNGLLVIRPASSVFISDIRYTRQAKQEVRHCKRMLITKIGLFEEAAKKKILGREKVGFESHQITYAQYRTLRKLFPAASFASTANIVEDVMLVKDEGEVAAIRRAVEISDAVFNEILGIIRPGIAEHEIAAEISYRHKSHGADRDAFETIVASGERGALPHARATDKKIKSGELLTLDFGCVVDGYHSDLTRTVAIGAVSRQAKKMYSAVHDAQQEAIASAKGNMWARDLDAVARRRLAKHGFGKFFTHSLGHGLGMNVHERPRVSHMSKEKLRVGSVITIEPGVYLPEIGGVRIEDDVVLTESGCVVLNQASKEFIEL
jgi:Xaa-Pro aminopeptidase